MQRSGVGFLGDPAQRPRQIAAELGDPEIVGAQQFVRDAVVERHQHRTAPDNRTRDPAFIGEGGLFLPHDGVGE